MNEQEINQLIKDNPDEIKNALINKSLTPKQLEDYNEFMMGQTVGLDCVWTSDFERWAWLYFVKSRQK